VGDGNAPHEPFNIMDVLENEVPSPLSCVVKITRDPIFVFNGSSPDQIILSSTSVPLILVIVKLSGAALKLTVKFETYSSNISSTVSPTPIPGCPPPSLATAHNRAGGLEIHLVAPPFLS
jgi:hypothetical protein